jgi:hypothetical protein
MAYTPSEALCENLAALIATQYPNMKYSIRYCMDINFNLTGKPLPSATITFDQTDISVHYECLSDDCNWSRVEPEKEPTSVPKFGQKKHNSYNDH